MYQFCDEKWFELACQMASRIFGDPLDYTQEMFRRAGAENLLLELQDDEIVSMAFLLPFTLMNHCGHYIYAACTNEKYRGQGRMTALLTQAQAEGRKRGDVFSFLLPASDGLFEFYRDRGYTTPYYCGFELVSGADEPAVALRDVTQDQFFALRKKHLIGTGGLCHGESAAAMAYYDVMDSGGHVLTDGENLAVCYPDRTGVFVKELLTNPTGYARMITGVLQRYGQTACTIQSRNCENQYVMGLLKWIAQMEVDEIYGNLLLD